MKVDVAAFITLLKLTPFSSPCCGNPGRHFPDCYMKGECVCLPLPAMLRSKEHSSAPNAAWGHAGMQSATVAQA